MKLGACYNVFDGEELLEASILSIRTCVDYVVVVYQVISNWGNKHSNPFFEEFLLDLKERKLVDELLRYEPRLFGLEERKRMISQVANPNEIDTHLENIGNVFFNELQKRELGRQKCKANSCTHFMSMDTDEFYKSAQLLYVKKKVVEDGLDACACRMRIFFKLPIYEYYPPDDLNCVSLINEIKEHCPMLLSHPYPVIIDPTRRMANFHRFHLFPREDIEMFHYSLVRKNMRVKLENVSNRGNYDLYNNLETFLARYEQWTLGDPVLHPHPFIGSMFRSVRTVENLFNIQLQNQCHLCCKAYAAQMQPLKRCGRCKKVFYCSVRCQKTNWSSHKPHCKPT